jgi:predicted PurR-regulated permease PerM
MLDGFFIQPYIFSKRVLAHPLEIFLIILIGADLYGPLGMILAVPTYTVLRVVARTFFNEYRFVQKFTENLDDELDDDKTTEAEGV